MLMVLCLSGYKFFAVLQDTVINLIGKRALVLATEIAAEPEVIHCVSTRNQKEINVVFTRLNKLSDADYIVLLDDHENRLFHPNKDLIGLKGVGHDNAEALLDGKNYISIQHGESGFSIRGKAAIFNAENKIIGVVSVGYLIYEVSDRIRQYAMPILEMFILGCLLTCLTAYLFSRHIKKQMFNMEPKEIASNLSLQKLVMESIHDGVIAVDADGVIINMNQTALDILHIDATVPDMIDQLLFTRTNPNTFFLPESMPPEMNDELISCNGTTILATRNPMITAHGVAGTVYTIRTYDEITSLTEKLSQVQHYVDNLRVVRHEHNNQMSIIGGLIEIGEYEQALLKIRGDSSRQQKEIDHITHKFNSKQISALLLGKSMRAKELGLILEIDEMSSLSRSSLPLSDHELSAIIGNLIDNACEATLKNDASDRHIHLLLSDATQDLMIIVTDHGIGLQGKSFQSCLAQGATSKTTSGHGIGLHLVNQYVQRVNGNMFCEDVDPSGLMISIYIPI
jgi:two-component system cit operon sensor histidine kinase CitA